MPLSPFGELHAIANKFGNPSRKKEVLCEAMQTKVLSLELITQYHDTLLFLLAYPENEELFSLAKNALEKLTADLKNKKSSFAEKFNESGIIHSKLVFSPSFDLLKRLNKLFPKQIYFDSSSATKETVSRIFKLILPVAEHETIDKKDLLFLQRIRQLRKGKSSGEVEWLIDLFESSRFFES